MSANEDARRLQDLSLAEVVDHLVKQRSSLVNHALTAKQANIDLPESHKHDMRGVPYGQYSIPQLRAIETEYTSLNRQLRECITENRDPHIHVRASIEHKLNKAQRAAHDERPKEERNRVDVTRNHPYGNYTPAERMAAVHELRQVDYLIQEAKQRLEIEKQRITQLPQLPDIKPKPEM